jgi:hypothetical protein
MASNSPWLRPTLLLDDNWDLGHSRVDLPLQESFPSVGCHQIHKLIPVACAIRRMDLITCPIAIRPSKILQNMRPQVGQSPDPCFLTSTLLGIGGVTRSVSASSLGGIRRLDHISDATLRYRARSRCALREALAGNRKLTINRSLWHILTRWTSDILSTLCSKSWICHPLKSLIIRSIDCTGLHSVT